MIERWSDGVFREVGWIGDRVWEHQRRGTLGRIASLCKVIRGPLSADGREGGNKRDIWRDEGDKA